MGKPTSKPAWTQGNGDASVAVEPSGLKKTTGWEYQEPPARQWMNWLFRIISDWIDWSDTLHLAYGSGMNDVPTTHRHVFITASVTGAADCNVRLPAAAANIAGMEVTLIKTDVKGVTYEVYIRPTGAGLLQGVNTVHPLDEQYYSVTAWCDGTKWWLK